MWRNGKTYIISDRTDRNSIQHIHKNMAQRISKRTKENQTQLSLFKLLHPLSFNKDLKNTKSWRTSEDYLLIPIFCCTLSWTWPVSLRLLTENPEYQSKLSEQKFKGSIKVGITEKYGSCMKSATKAFGNSIFLFWMAKDKIESMS